MTKLLADLFLADPSQPAITQNPMLTMHFRTNNQTGAAVSIWNQLLTSHDCIKRDAFMTTKHQAAAKDAAEKLKAIHDELLHLELATGAPCLRQATLSTALALAWCNLAIEMPLSYPVNVTTVH